MADRAIQVQCYAGYKGDQRPLRIRLQDGFHEIAEIEDRWYSPGETFFRIRLANGDRYVLCRQEAQDVWTIQAFRSGGTQAVH